MYERNFIRGESIMKSRGYLLATASSVAAAAAATGGAQAADLARKAPPPAPVVAPPSWTGFYVGVHAGINWQLASAEYAAPHFGSTGASLPAGNAAGFIGGGQIGYNWQFAPQWVIGVEGTISGLTGKATAKPEFTLTKGNGFSSEINWLATIRGRVGWLVDPDTMIYGTGGAAWGGVKNSANPNGFGSSTAAAVTKSESKTKSGWVAGGGIEHILGGAWSHWTLGVEVLYVDLGDSTPRVSVDNKGTKFNNKAAIGQLKLNYRF
jgi:outer membrane immunogenic protein